MPELPNHPTLRDLQNYVARVTTERGFADETTAEVFMLFLEECGELAKAARKLQHLKTDANSATYRLDHEAVDVLNYLLQICNRFEIDLESAFREKETLNNARTWK